MYYIYIYYFQSFILVSVILLLVISTIDGLTSIYIHVMNIHTFFFCILSILVFLRSTKLPYLKRQIHWSINFKQVKSILLWE